MKKMTKREYFATIRSYIESSADSKIGAVPVDEVLGFIDHEVELLTKKNSSEKKPTAQQIANGGVKTAIAEGMKPNRLYTITEIQKEIPECAEMSNQRISALVRQMVADGIIVRTEDKRKAYFSLAE